MRKFITKSSMWLNYIKLVCELWMHKKECYLRKVYLQIGQQCEGGSKSPWKIK